MTEWTDFYGALFAYPGSDGSVTDHRGVIQAAKSAEVVVAVVADLLALCVLEAPGHFGADIVVGSAQRFGVPLGAGGPHAGFIATTQRHQRALPGRLVGVSIDSHDQPAYRLALQTREQHIRREKATSNICTAQVLLAVISAMYGIYHGADGLRSIATSVAQRADALARRLGAAGAQITNTTWFDTLSVATPAVAEQVVQGCALAGINVRHIDDDHWAVSVDETTTDADIKTITGVVESVMSARNAEFGAVTPDGIESAEKGLPSELVRTSTFMEHETFTAYRSETAMLRYLRRLSDKDLALDRTMIPLGSCTMKLNATTEMVPVTWPEFGDIHPFAPADQTLGYRQLIDELIAWLCEICGYDAASLQPNAGSQGEFAGLLAIAGYHHSRDDAQRTVCLIPSSAHGTNAASAVMAGMSVKVVACDESGNIDLVDLREKVDAAGDTLAAIMVTYPSTHGVFEESITEVCEVIHAGGGQVYLDGANINAMVGLARPGDIGADVSHLNLHKTFCIPHGGGGPGVGPVALKAHLAPFLPHEHHDLEETAAVGPVSAAPWGSASVLPISWAYLRLMGPAGLTEASKIAICAANYVARRLNAHYPVLYSGRDGLVAHECILDIRPIEAETGITAEDIAKRLIDFGFHAPTMSFPVAGTLMVEPTESEELAELDRFIEAMIQIRREISQVADGVWTAENSPLRHAPHTAVCVTADDWSRDYPRSVAAYPVSSVKQNKYWSPVGRIDNGYGDRNLACTCPPPEAFEQ